MKIEDLKFTPRALYELDNILDKPLMSYLHDWEKDLQGPNPERALNRAVLAKVIWAGLLHKNPNLTLDEVIDDMPPGIVEFSEIAGNVFSAVFSEFLDDAVEAESEGDKQPGKSVGTGKRS